MKNKSYTTAILVNQPLHKAYEAVNNVRGWWTENTEGQTHQLNDEFEVRFGDVHYSKQILTEVIPDTKVVWLVTDSKLNFVKDQQEWTNTKIVFELSESDGKTLVRFTHDGLKDLIETGKGKPEPKVN